jgi:hypothetical protein
MIARRNGGDPAGTARRGTTFAGDGAPAHIQNLLGKKGEIWKWILDRTMLLEQYN